MKKITEGMRAGDLEDLVLPMISVDEYESKVDDNAVVFSFFVNDSDAAKDLNRFLQKSPITIIDTDISPAPDQHGYYLVFFELLNNDRICENVSDILEEVSPLVGHKSWQMRLRGVERLIAFSESALESHLDAGEKNTDDEIAETIMAFLQPSLIETVKIHGESLLFEGYGYSEKFDIIAFGPLDKIIKESDLAIQTEDVGLSAIVKNRQLDRKLGEGWSVSSIEGLSMLARFDSDDALILRAK